MYLTPSLILMLWLQNWQSVQVTFPGNGDILHWTQGYIIVNLGPTDELLTETVLPV